MSPEAQRIAIATACGWERSPNAFPGSRKWMRRQADGTWTSPEPLPDFLNDLNAMADAEKMLDSKDQDVRSLFLDYLLLSEEGNDDWDMHRTRFEADYHSVRATAAQRAEAFLRALNLWDDSK